MARSSVFEAATVIVSSDWTCVPPIWAYAVKKGAGTACAVCGFGFCDCRSGERPALSVAAVCAKPVSGKAAAIENIDAPKIKARERLAPSAITTPTLFLCFGLGWRALHEKQQLAGYQFEPQAPRPHLAIIGYEPALARSRKDGAVYIDCKSRLLDCRPIDL